MTATAKGVVGLSSTHKFLADQCIPTILVRMVATDHCFNLESRQETCEVLYTHTCTYVCAAHEMPTPIRSRGCEVFENSRKYLDSRKFRPPSYTVVQTTWNLHSVDAGKPNACGSMQSLGVARKFQNPPTNKGREGRAVNSSSSYQCRLCMYHSRRRESQQMIIR